MTRRTAGEFNPSYAKEILEIEYEENLLTQLLYDSFVQGNTQSVLADFQVLLVGKKIKQLSVVVQSEDDFILDLPWEFLAAKLAQVEQDELNGEVALEEISIFRSINFSQENPSLEYLSPLGAPLKLLFIAALPENSSMESKMLAIEEEQQKLIDSIGQLESNARPKIVVEWLSAANLRSIREALQARSHDIIHISGHGAFQKDKQLGTLILEDESGNERSIDGKVLGEIIESFPSVKLIIINACETARGGSNSFVGKLSQVGVPVVVGMQISNSRFCSHFFYCSNFITV